MHTGSCPGRWGKAKDAVRHIGKAPGVGSRRQKERRHNHIREIVLKHFLQKLIGPMGKGGGLAVIPLQFLNFHTVPGSDFPDFFQSLIQVLFADAAQEHGRLHFLCANLRILPLACKRGGKRNSGG